jgi:hypothetical protein
MHAEAPSSLVEPHTPKAICAWRRNIAEAQLIQTVSDPNMEIRRLVDGGKGYKIQTWRKKKGGKSQPVKDVGNTSFK